MFGKSRAKQADHASEQAKRANCENGEAFCNLLEAIATSAVPVYRNPQPLKPVRQRVPRRPGQPTAH